MVNAKTVPLDAEFLSSYKGHIDWKELASREDLPSDTEFYEKLENKSFWESLSANRYLRCITHEMLEKFQPRWDWKKLSAHPNLPWSKELVAKFVEKWDWEILSGNRFLPWSEDLILLYRDKWFFRPNYYETYNGMYWDMKENINCLSSNSAIYWDERLLELFKEKVCFFRIALFCKVSDAAIVLYAGEFDKEFKSGNWHVRWSDFTDDFEIIKTGWDCFSENQLFSISPANLPFYQSHDCKFYFVTNKDMSKNDVQVVVPSIGSENSRSRFAAAGYVDSKTVKVIDILNHRYLKNAFELIKQNSK